MGNKLSQTVGVALKNSLNRNRPIHFSHFGPFILYMLADGMECARLLQRPFYIL
jgi:hypothetical protein